MFDIFQTAGSKQDTSGNGDHPPNKRMRTSGGNHGKTHASFAYQVSNNHHQQSHNNHQSNRSSSSQRQTNSFNSPGNTNSQFLPQPQRRF